MLCSLCAAFDSGSLWRQLWGDCEQREERDGANDQITHDQSRSAHVRIRYVIDASSARSLIIAIYNVRHKNVPLYFGL